MNDIRIEMNNAGVQELLHTVGETICTEKAREIAGACGDGYESDMFRGTTRTMASVFTESKDPDEILRHLK